MVTRRKFLKSGLTAVLAGSLSSPRYTASVSSDDYFNGDDIEVNFFLDTETYDTGEEKRDNPLYAGEVMEAYASRSLSNLLERAESDAEVKTHVIDHPINLEKFVGNSVESAPMNEVFHGFNEWLSQSSDVAIHSNVLLTAKTQNNRGIGLSEFPFKDHSACRPDVSESNAAVIGGLKYDDRTLYGSGRDIVDVDLEELEEEFLGYAWEDEHEMIVVQNPKYQAIISGLHEIGHNICLSHPMGDVELLRSNSETAVYKTTPMLLSHAYRLDKDFYNNSYPNVGDKDSLVIDFDYGEPAVTYVSQARSQ